MKKSLKKKIQLISITAMLGITVGVNGVVEAKENPIHVIVEGRSVAFPDQMPTMESGRTLIPVRAVTEAMGIEVTFNDKTNQVSFTKGSDVVELTLNSKATNKNGTRLKDLDVPAKSVKGRTFVPLRFIAEAFGSKVDWNGNTNTISISNGTTEPSKEQSKGTVVRGIKVKHGQHTYAVANQAQYDEVMKIVEDALEKADEVVFGGNYTAEYEKYFDAYPNWDKSDRSQVNVDRSIGALWKAGVSKQEIEWLYKLSVTASRLSQQRDAGRDGTPRSAYDELVTKVGDCDSAAQAHSAVFDAAGFNTAIIAGNAHATMVFEVNGKWFYTGGGTFTAMKSLSLGQGEWFLSNPTF